MSEARPLPEWFVEQQLALFAQAERPLAALLPELDRGAWRTLARTLFSTVHGIVALGLEEKLVSQPLPDLRNQLAATVRAIATGGPSFERLTRVIGRRIFARADRGGRMAIEIRQVSPHFVAEISGINLAKPVDRAAVDTIWAAIDHYAMLVFHDQQLDDTQLRDFAGNFGAL